MEEKICKGRIPGKWDDQIIYKKAIKTYKKFLKKREKTIRDIRELREYFAVSVALTMITNGCRVREAIDALVKAALKGEREVEVRVRKKRKQEYRKVIIPDIINFDLIRQQVDFWNPDKRHYVHLLLKRLFGHNCHSCRYAFITYLGVEKQISPAIIQKIIHHSSLDMLSHYIEEKKAEEKLKDIVNEVLKK